jgi:CubicO group peptidase (beta-lactamase class C family)
MPVRPAVLAALALLAAGPVAAARPDPRALEQVADQVFADFTAPGAPGCAVALIDNGRIVLQKGYGLASVEHGLPIDPRVTVFDIGSTSKQFTAASILLLAQDGKLSLDDDIRRYLPELPEYPEPVTLRHLLHHTSGIPDYIELLVLGGFSIEDHTTAEDALRAIARQSELDFAPGSQHSYSNSGYFLLSVVVERVGGQPLAAFARERIFAPLGMDSTRILDDHTAVVPHRAGSYDLSGEGNLVLSLSNWEQVGDGAVQTTVGDLAKWDANFYQPGVGGAWLVEQLQTTGQLDDGTPLDYARGLMVSDYRGLRMVSHGGAWIGFRSNLVRFPDQRVSAMALCNVAAAQPDALLMPLVEAYLAGEFADAPGAPTAAGATTDSVVPLADPGRYAGLYVGSASGLARRVELREGRLWYVRGPGNETELAHLGEDRFRMLGAPTPTVASFASDAGGRVVRITIGDGNDAVALERVAAVSPTPAELQAYAGSYASAELDTRWTVTVDGGQLLVRGRRGPAYPLQPLSADLFGSPAGLLRFERENAYLVGFSVIRQRARGLRFRREP